MSPYHRKIIDAVNNVPVLKYKYKVEQGSWTLSLMSESVISLCDREQDSIIDTLYRYATDKRRNLDKPNLLLEQPE